MSEVVFAHHQLQLSSDKLLEFALRRQEGILCANQAFVVNTGKRTGRSPKDRFIVKDEQTATTVDWGAINQPIAPEKFTALWQRAVDYLSGKEVFVSRLQVGAEAEYSLPVTVITELAWHNLFVRQLFIRDKAVDTTRADAWTILNAPGLITDPNRDGVNSDAALLIDFTQRRVLLCGLQYAGEMKKAMFSVLNYLLPAVDVLPMHCSANVGQDGDVALFFGLSGTGKTTLSADPERLLIGDDEHGWSASGVFNFEGGCYAKCIHLSEQHEPLIWSAIRQGAILENVVIDPVTLAPQYDDDSLTENTRAAYPLEHIEARVVDNKGKLPTHLIFLCCDLYGVLPPLAELTPEQAAYYFLSGYTALVASTEVGSDAAIKPTFSTCFGAPFFPRSPTVYADLLMKRINESQAQVYLLNTGWTGGAHGQGGERFSIPTTRTFVRHILNGEAARAPKEHLPGFELTIPKALPDIDAHLLNPQLAWQDSNAYKTQARHLINQFITNFKRFNVSEKIRAAGPHLESL